MNDIFSIIEEYINEISDELADKVHDMRIDNVRNAQTKDEIVKANDKLKNNIKLMNARDHRKEDKKKAIEDFKKFWDGRTANIRDINKAGEEQSNARINQGLRNYLEKIYALESLVEAFLNETSLTYRTTHRENVARGVYDSRKKALEDALSAVARPVNQMEKNLEQGREIPQELINTATEATKKADRAQSRVNDVRKILKEAYDLLGLFEGDVIDFQKKKKEIETQKERDSIANEVNNMMASGETRKVRQTSGGNLIGDPKTLKKLYGLKDRLKKLCGEDNG